MSEIQSEKKQEISNGQGIKSDNSEKSGDEHVRQVVTQVNEGSPGQALKRLLGLRTFGSPAAQTLASHTSFAGM